MVVSSLNDLTQLRRQLIGHSNDLVGQESQDSMFKLMAINSSLRQGTEDAPDNLSAHSLAASNRQLANAMIDSLRGDSREAVAGVARTFNHALRIARGEILVPELSKQNREDLISVISSHYKVELGGFFHENPIIPLIMSFTVPAGTRVSAMCSDLIIGCKGLQRPRLALEGSNYGWIERNSHGPLNEDRDVRIEVGARIPRAANLPIEQQIAIAQEAGLTLPDRSIATIAHSLAYLMTGRSLYEGYAARLADGNGLSFGDRGLKFEFGQKIALFSQVFPVRQSVV